MTPALAYVLGIATVQVLYGIPLIYLRVLDRLDARARRQAQEDQ